MESVHHWAAPSPAILFAGLLGSVLCINVYLLAQQPAKVQRSGGTQQAAVRREFNGTMDLWVIAGQSNAWVGGHGCLLGKY